MSEPNPPEPLLQPYERVTAEHIASVNTALEACKGDYGSAGEVLGLSKNRVIQIVGSSPALYARWKNDTATLGGEVKVNDTTIINRVPPKSLNLTEQEKTAIALTVTEKKLNKSLVKLGFKSKEIEAISAVEEFAGQHFEETLSIMHGGLLKSAMRLMLLAERIESDYLQNEAMEEKDRKWWWDQYFRILERMRDMNDQTNKAALTRALIDIKKKEAGKLGKPGLSQMPLVNINVNSAPEPKKSKLAEGWTPPPAPEESTS